MYFENFPFIKYTFGDEVTPTVFQKLNAYVDIVDQVKGENSFYSLTNIREGQRADNMSYELYGTTELYWTFYLMNDGIRLSGWPLATREVRLLAQKYHPHVVVTTTSEIFNTFLVGQTVRGQLSGASGTVIKRNMDLGQLFIEIDDDSSSPIFQKDESILYVNEESITISTSVYSVTEQYNATHHWENSEGKHVDIDPFTQETGLNVPVSFQQSLENRNAELKLIRVLNPDAARSVSQQFNQAMRA